MAVCSYSLLRFLWEYGAHVILPFAEHIAQFQHDFGVFTAEIVLFTYVARKIVQFAAVILEEAYQLPVAQPHRCAGRAS